MELPLLRFKKLHDWEWEAESEIQILQTTSQWDSKKITRPPGTCDTVPCVYPCISINSCDPRICSIQFWGVCNRNHYDSTTYSPFSPLFSPQNFYWKFLYLLSSSSSLSLFSFSMLCFEHHFIKYFFQISLNISFKLQFSLPVA